MGRFWPLILLGVIGIILYEQQPTWLVPKALEPTPIPTRSAVAFLADAGIAYRSGDIAGAIESYEEVMRLEPDNSRPLAELSDLYLVFRNIPKSLSMAERAVDLAPDDPRALNALARIQDWTGDYESAINNALDALEVEPQNATTMSILGEIYTDIGNWDVAADYLEQALAIDDQNVTALRNLAYLYETRGDYETAIEMYDRAIAAAPYRSDLYIEKGRQYRVGLLDYESAIESYRQAVEVYESAVTLDALGSGLYNAGNHLQAVRVLRQAVELDANYGPALVHLGMALYPRRNYEDAAVALEKGLNILGDDVRIEQIYTLGLAHIYKEPTECDKAMIWLREALEVDPESGPALEGISLCESN